MFLFNLTACSAASWSTVGGTPKLIPIPSPPGPVTVVDNSPLHVKNLSYYKGVQNNFLIKFEEPASEPSDLKFDLFIGDSPDSYISYTFDAQNTVITDDGITRKYSFEFTDYGAMANQGVSVSLQLTQVSDPTQVSLKTPAIVFEPYLAAQNYQNDIFIQVKENTSDTDPYSVVHVYSQQGFIDGNEIYEDSQNTQNNDGSMRSFLSHFTDYSGSDYAAGTKLHITVTTVSGLTVDLGEVEILKY